jgi:hypothetical protein
MVNNFNYIIEKVKKATFIKDPYPHLYIKDFISEEHLDIILRDTQIHFKEVFTDDELYNELIKQDYKIQQFPGCANTWITYKKILQDKAYIENSDLVESMGITFRLDYQDIKSDIIKELVEFMNGDNFHQTLKDKFGLIDKTNIISAIQKNLNRYEISPHPDIRSKALTYLLNINKDKSIEFEDVHTHILEFKKKDDSLIKYWVENPDKERQWTSWDRCNTVKICSKNNTMLMFAPQSNPPTLHGVKLNYDHKRFQRTQIYGNLLYDN